MHSKNKNLCSGYFCSFIPLTFSNSKNNISILNGQYKKQITDELSKYNKDYMNKLGNKCSDIITKHYEKSYETNSMSLVTQKYNPLGKCSELRGSFKYNNLDTHKQVRVSGTEHSHSRSKKEEESRRENSQRYRPQ